MMWLCECGFVKAATLNFINSAPGASVICITTGSMQPATQNIYKEEKLDVVLSASDFVAVYCLTLDQFKSLVSAIRGVCNPSNGISKYHFPGEWKNYQQLVDIWCMILSM